MLIIIKDHKEIDERKLMDVYAEGNYENVEYFFPEEKNITLGIKKVEEGFLDFLKNEFFKNINNRYYVLEKDGIWISALRLHIIKNNFYYLEALETRVDYRRQGYATKLLESVINELKKYGSFKICDCVSKRNLASLETHKKCGFKIVADKGYDYLRNEESESDYSLEYEYKG